MTRLETLEKNMDRIRGLASCVSVTNEQRTEAAVFAMEIPFLWGELEEAKKENETLTVALDSQEDAHRDRFRAEDKLKKLAESVKKHMLDKSQCCDKCPEDCPNRLADEVLNE